VQLESKRQLNSGEENSTTLWVAAAAESESKMARGASIDAAAAEGETGVNTFTH
jgi:hypothetical protein